MWPQSLYCVSFSTRRTLLCSRCVADVSSMRIQYKIQRIQYKIISITHNLLHITELKYLHRLTNIKPPSSTRFSDHLCLSLPPISTRLKFADRSFRNSSPRLWKFLPTNLWSFASDTHQSTIVNSSTPSHPCRAVSISRHQFLSCLKTYLFTLFYPP